MIIIVYKSLIQVGGAEKFLHEFFYNLKKYHEVKIMCKEYDKDVLKFFNIDKNHIISPLKNNYWSWFYLLFTKIKRNQTIIVHSGFKDIYLISILKKFKQILFIHHPYFNSLDHFDLLSFIHFKRKKAFIKSKENKSFYKKLEEKAKKKTNYFLININAILIYLAFKNASNTVVLSEYGKKEKREIFNINSNYFPPAISQKFINEFENFTKIEKENQIIYFGRLSKEKRVDVLINAFNSINIDYTLKIIGIGEELENLKDLAHENEKIIFSGFLNDKDLFHEIKKSKLLVTLEWADYNLTVYESIILGTRVLFGKTFEVEKNDDKLIKNNMLFYCNPSKNDVAEKIIKIINLKNPELSDYSFLKNNTWERYVLKFSNEILKL